MSKRVRVFHSYYGCETGCCGHVVEIVDHDDDGVFEFAHPRDKTEAVELAKSAIRQRWPECFDTIDWSTLEFEEGSC